VTKGVCASYSVLLATSQTISIFPCCRWEALEIRVRELEEDNKNLTVTITKLEVCKQGR